MFARRFSEITARGRFRAVKSAAEINPVQIQLHDFLFAELLLDPAWQRQISRSLRRKVRSLSEKLLRASCCVIVLAPWRTWPAVKFFSAARTIPKRS